METTTIFMTKDFAKPLYMNLKQAIIGHNIGQTILLSTNNVCFSLEMFLLLPKFSNIHLIEVVGCTNLSSFEIPKLCM